MHESDKNPVLDRLLFDYVGIRLDRIGKHLESHRTFTWGGRKPSETGDPNAQILKWDFECWPLEIPTPVVQENSRHAGSRCSDFLHFLKLVIERLQYRSLLLIPLPSRPFFPVHFVADTEVCPAMCLATAQELFTICSSGTFRHLPCIRTTRYCFQQPHYLQNKERRDGN